MVIRFWKLTDMEVVNIRTGKILGHVGDISIDADDGCLCEIFVPRGAKYWGCIGRKGEYRIPFCSIKKFGSDAIIVDIDEKKCIDK